MSTSTPPIRDSTEYIGSLKLGNFQLISYNEFQFSEFVIAWGVLLGKLQLEIRLKNKKQLNKLHQNLYIQNGQSVFLHSRLVKLEESSLRRKKINLPFNFRCRCSFGRPWKMSYSSFPLRKTKLCVYSIHSNAQEWPAAPSFAPYLTQEFLDYLSGKINSGTSFWCSHW